MTHDEMAVEAVGAAIDRVHAVISSRANPNARPSRLFHFTDAAGVVGILTGKQFWASLAVSQNDQSEVVWAAQVAMALTSDSIVGDPEFNAALQRFL